MAVFSRFIHTHVGAIRFVNDPNRLRLYPNDWWGITDSPSQWNSARPSAGQGWEETDSMVVAMVQAIPDQGQSGRRGEWGQGWCRGEVSEEGLASGGPEQSSPRHPVGHLPGAQSPCCQAAQVPGTLLVLNITLLRWSFSGAIFHLTWLIKMSCCGGLAGPRLS